MVTRLNIEYYKDKSKWGKLKAHVIWKEYEK